MWPFLPLVTNKAIHMEAVRISIQIKTVRDAPLIFIFTILVANGLNDMANMAILWNNNNKERNLTHIYNKHTLNYIVPKNRQGLCILSSSPHKFS